MFKAPSHRLTQSIQAVSLLTSGWVTLLTTVALWH